MHFAASISCSSIRKAAERFRCRAQRASSIMKPRPRPADRLNRGYRMNRPNKSTLVIFVTTLCPVAALLGMLICSIGMGARMPLQVAVVDAGIYVLGFLVTASFGYVVATSFLPAPRSKLLAGRLWAFPVACGLVVSLASTLIEPTTDVLGRFFSHRHDDVWAAGGTILWSAISTLVVLGIDWLSCRKVDRKFDK
jgi:hypothetical protein